jgi:hypothetical protein
MYLSSIYREQYLKVSQATIELRKVEVEDDRSFDVLWREVALSDVL